MPLKSKAQQRYLFATHPEIAKEFAAKTVYNPNTKRTLLAHNAILQEVNCFPNGEQKVGNYVVGNGEKREILTADFLQKIIKLAQSLSVKLNNSFLEAIRKS